MEQLRPKLEVYKLPVEIEGGKGGGALFELLLAVRLCARGATQANKQQATRYEEMERFHRYVLFLPAKINNY